MYSVSLKEVFSFQKLSVVCLAINKTSISQPLPKAQGASWERKEVERLLGPDGQEHQTEAVSSRLDRIPTLVSSPAYASFGCLHKIKPVNIPAWKVKRL